MLIESLTSLQWKKLNYKLIHEQRWICTIVIMNHLSFTSTYINLSVICRKATRAGIVPSIRMKEAGCLFDSFCD